MTCIAPRLQFAVEATPLAYVGNLPALVEQLGKLAESIRPDRNQEFATWIRRHGDDLERSSEERNKLAVDGEPILTTQQQRRIWERSIAVADDLNDRRQRIVQLAGRPSPAKDLTAIQLRDIVAEVSEPWFAPFASLRATGIQGYWRYWSRFDCALRQYRNVTFDSVSALKQRLPECSLVDDPFLQALNSQGKEEEEKDNSVGERIEANRLLGGQLSTAFSGLPSAEQALTYTALAEKEFADERDLPLLARSVLGYDSVLMEKVPVPLHVAVFAVPVIVVALAIFLAMQNVALRRSRVDSAVSDLPVNARFVYPTSTFFRSVAAALTAVFASAMFWTCADAPWWTGKVANLGIAATIAATYFKAASWFQDLDGFTLLWMLAGLAIAVELWTRMRVTS